MSASGANTSRPSSSNGPARPSSSNGSSRPSSSNGSGKVPPPMSGLPIRPGAAGGPASKQPTQKQPAQTAASTQTAASRLSDPQFKLKEKMAAKAVMILKNQDKQAYPKNANPEVQFGGRFIHNKPYIEKTQIYGLARKAPKGAHLHIHLNACLPPNFLLMLAAHKDFENNMYISTNLQNQQQAATVSQQRKTAKQTKNSFPEPLTKERLSKAKIQFHFLPKGWPTKSLFDARYCGRIGPTEKAEDKTYDVMKYRDFLREFSKNIYGAAEDVTDDAKLGRSKVLSYLMSRLVFQKEEVVFGKGDVNDKDQTGSVKKQWALFDTRTQMMKGLFMAETAYRKYMSALFSSFDADKIQYAELRPNFMAANSVIRTPTPDRQSKTYKEGQFSYDPNNKMDNKEIMNLIIDEFELWKRSHPNATFKSMKVIVCTPRSPFYPMKFVATTMQECYEMKKNPKFGPYIAGFDFIGPEHEGRKLSQFNTEVNPDTKQPWNLLNKWKDAYKQVGIEWLLHCGESLRDDDGNLDVAVNQLQAKRLSHGYAIPAKQAILKTLSEAARNPQRKTICVDTCPDSNEDLGLYCSAQDAVVYRLLANGIPCTVSCDNPTLFSSTLSHEFYQVMVGQDNFGLMEWRKLMEDSIRHSVWNDENPQGPVRREWEQQYERFVYGILEKYGSLVSGKQ